jgi:hypothetical protein
VSTTIFNAICSLKLTFPFLQENVMSDPIRPYEPLTSENAALVLVDHQVGLMTGVRDYSTGELKHNVVALAKAAKALKLPIIVTTTARYSMWGPTFPELVEALPGFPIIDRSSVNAFDDPNVAQAIATTGRKKLIFARDGVTQANAITFTAGTNSLTLQPGSSITGNVIAASTADTLALGGGGSASFDVSQIGSSAQYQGFGVFQKTDSSTWTLTGTNSSALPWTINQGVLVVNGTMSNSTMTVNSGAALFGTGTVGSTVVNSGGFLVPGNSPGTLTISGNLALQSGAFYIVQVNPTTASTTNVSGTASLAGTVGAVFATGSYVTRSYTILTAAGGVTGTFDAGAVRGLPAGFQPSLTYTGNTVVLNLEAHLVSGPTTPPFFVSTPKGPIVLSTLPTVPGLSDEPSTETQPSQPAPLPPFTTNQLNAGLATTLNRLR